MSDWSLTQLKTATELVSSDSNETDWALISYFDVLITPSKGATCLKQMSVTMVRRGSPRKVVGEFSHLSLPVGE